MSDPLKRSHPEALRRLSEASAEPALQESWPVMEPPASTDEEGEELLDVLLPSGHSSDVVGYFRHRASESLLQPGELLPGHRIGRFVLRELLGQGGMGQVWDAEDTRLRRRVALKLVLPSRMGERGLERFLREARAGGRLMHPNVVQTLACGEDSGRAWIAQELIAGARTLRDFLAELRNLDQLPEGHYREVAELTSQVARGLEAAHAAGVIHRDIKPGNILLSREGVPKLADFGLAQLRDDSFLSQSGDFVGTWAYMSPEQVGGGREALEHPSDVFTLGVVLYELLTQRRPFDGDSSAQLADQIRHQDPPRADVVHSRVPKDLAIIASKAMEKSPGARYQTALELAEDLERFLHHQPILARPPGIVCRLGKWVRRNPALSAAAGVMLVALIVVAGLAFDLAHQTALARRQQEAVLRLSVQVDLEELVEEQALLWPAREGLVPELEQWIARAEQLVAALPEHQATLERLSLGSVDVSADSKLGSGMRVSERGERWWRERLTRLIAEIESLEHDLLDPRAVTGAHGWSVSRRLAFARDLERAAAEGGRTHAAWGRYLPEILADHPGLELEPRSDLLPLGRDPSSRLWEFAHLPSGEPALRGEDGELHHPLEFGLVLVLIPGGRDYLGSQGADPDGPNYDPDGLAQPVELREVELEPYFISKYEVTQQQWAQITGQAPVEYGGASPHCPVAQVTWPECATFCERMGLVLPTEEEWEFAARAGTDTPFWTGRGLEELVVAANVADQSQRKVTRITWVLHDPIEDGYVEAAPVGSFAPNPFGLHEVHGNVWEWCQDAYGDFGYALPYSESELSALPDHAAVRRAYRGGSFNDRANHARSANRLMDLEGYKTYALGLRPALRL